MRISYQLPALSNQVGSMLRAKYLALCLSLLALCFFTGFKSPTYKMGKLKYSGGGDWYGNRTALPNLIDFCNKNIATNFSADEGIVDVGSAEIFNGRWVFAYR